MGYRWVTCIPILQFIWPQLMQVTNHNACIDQIGLSVQPWIQNSMDKHTEKGNQKMSKLSHSPECWSAMLTFPATNTSYHLIFLLKKGSVMKIHSYYFLWSRANYLQEKPITNFNVKRGQLPFYNVKSAFTCIHSVLCWTEQISELNPKAGWNPCAKP